MKVFRLFLFLFQNFLLYLQRGVRQTGKWASLLSETADYRLLNILN